MICGSARESLKLHANGTVDKLQTVLRQKVELFDTLIDIQEMDPWSAVRVIKYENEDELFFTGKKLFEKDFYTSTIAFPTVKKGEAGLRIMIRANMYDKELKDFAMLTKQIKEEWENIK